MKHHVHKQLLVFVRKFKYSQTHKEKQVDGVTEGQIVGVALEYHMF